MPRIDYLCSGCKKAFKKYFSKSGAITDKIKCKFCTEEADRQLSAPSSKSTMTLDNGVQGRATEIMHDIIDLNKERDKKGYNRGD